MPPSPRITILRGLSLILVLTVGTGVYLPVSVAQTPTPDAAAKRADAINAQGDVIKANRALQENIKQYRSSDARVRDYTDKLRPIEQQVSTLTEQLALMDEQIRVTTYKSESVKQEILDTDNAIARTKVELADSKVKVEKQAKVLFAYVRLIYAHKHQYYDPESKSLSELKLLLSNGSLSSTVGAGQSLQMVERAGQGILKDLETLSAELDGKQQALEEQQSRLSLLRTDLEEQRVTLEASQDAKEKLLEQTKGDEQKFQKLIRQAQAQREEAASELMALQGDLSILKNAAARLRASVSIDLRGLADKGKEANGLLAEGEDEQTLFEWPVPPSRGLSAYFIDPGYVEAFGVQHAALDIPTPQSSLIQAPADGVVYKAKDNGFGFSYVILIHRNGFATLYGHVSKIMVEEGDVVKRGNVVALSGGAPGTLGAGLRTTGAHLHWEVLKNGKRVDPLQYTELEPLRDVVPQSRLPVAQGSLTEDD